MVDDEGYRCGCFWFVKQASSQRLTMIISLIIGGLGNQFFQYAVARKIAHARQVPLKLELRGFKHPRYASHPYTLNHFNIVAEPARVSDYVSLAVRALWKPVLLKEHNETFNPEVSNVGDNVVLIGYWQDQRYFADISPLIRKELTLKAPPSAATARIGDAIATSKSVSIHVRRTDYINNPRNAEIFEECSLDYYRVAMKFVADRHEGAHFFVFSDDSAWAETNLRDGGFPMTFVNHNNVCSAHEDLFLMRQCKHNIIANSTFSWWGAWLNANPGKIVVSPKKWFRNSRRDESHLLPAEWIRL
jgi:hypothetical protein